MQPHELIASLRRGSRRALAKAISLAENNPQEGLALLEALGGRMDRGMVVGITGPPGVGKSSLIKALLDVVLEEGLHIAVLAVDPSSPFSGGALLGDRFRMGPCTEVAQDQLFIRSLSTRGNEGGLTTGITVGIDLLCNQGFDLVLVETAGVGQCEVDVVRVADLVCVMLTEGFGDELQAMKSGLMEVADLFVVNKCDRPGTERLVRDLQRQLQQGPRYQDPDWLRPDIVQTDAISGTGVAQLWAMLRALSGDAERRGAIRRKHALAHYELELAALLERFKFQLRPLARAAARDRLTRPAFRKAVLRELGVHCQRDGAGSQPKEVPSSPTTQE